mmetsp:Transcript_29848/g.77043  ORF Transcript_29848/g.77043 Transcript_29848/m.77043 type:complete len:191 (-) Transcript_29848:883-1455(-)
MLPITRSSFRSFGRRLFGQISLSSSKGKIVTLAEDAPSVSAKSGGLVMKTLAVPITDWDVHSSCVTAKPKRGGHFAVGEVTNVGNAKSEFKKGDIVVALCEGTWSKTVACPSDRSAKVPEGTHCLLIKFFFAVRAISPPCAFYVDLRYSCCCWVKYKNCEAFNQLPCSLMEWHTCFSFFSIFRSVSFLPL